MTSAIIHFLHLLASVIWIGGMVFTKAVFYPSLAVIDPQQKGKLQAFTAKRFTIIAWTCIITLLITGILQTPSDWLIDTSTMTTTMLLVKHVLILAAIIIGILITFVVAPKLSLNAPKPGTAPTQTFIKLQKRLELLAATNLILGVLILLFTSVWL